MDDGVVGLIAGLGMMLLVMVVVLYAFYGYCHGRILEKAGKPLWVGFVPVYNLIVLLEVIGRPWWWLLILIGCSFIPIVGLIGQLVVMIILMIDLAKCFGKDTTYGVLLGLFSFIMIPVLAFSDASYKGLSNANQTPTVS